MKPARCCNILLLLFLAGCGEEKVAVYSVPKEDSSPPPAVETPDSGAGIGWTAPKDWQEQPATEMRQGSFLVNGENGAKADISVVGFPGDAGGDLANVNRWRGQLKLEPFDEAGLSAAAQSVDTSGGPALLVELVETVDKPGGQGREILGAILHREDKSWFFKMMGDAAVVAAQKGAFIDFLRSVRFGGGEQAAVPPMASQMQMPAQSAGLSAPPVPGKPSWKLPPGWQEQPVGSFAFNEDDRKADVSVVALTGDAGGLLANVNRWRGQVSLPPLSESDLNADAAKVDVDGETAVVVDMAGAAPAAGAKFRTRILGAIIAHNGGTWFIKITGEDALVVKNKPAFIDFLKSFRFPDHG